ncbi:Mitochondrial import inner membrane translocase subunit-like protein [Hapsidospora chrysogenum ATCC 11550]|uniref:Mitochondrial import inner membrane translocase subunit n=1 Tax=Hapsidospora chrysogenum (strain ATCC 11550 / CBS 779.69 / DSM 880 / IAM 14645 / JCM 23072 / IMI 49137) TaxID=857340 RepID=A0A086TI20_HAPC1|nr:Mitochondrial import inner membrane translocase subunit-like protein [Hapsidospora chrysogenum ATCC 11550]
MESKQVKDAVMQQIVNETNVANARLLIEQARPVLRQRAPTRDTTSRRLTGPAAQKVQENCFEKCVPKPGGSMSSSESSCATSCMEKYMAAWNQVNSAYISRLRQEQGSL